MSGKYVVWWLSQQAAELIYESADIMQDLPDYICTQVKSRYGRPGRGRLWVPDDIPIEEIEWDEEKPMARIAGMCGGIVIKRSSISDVAHLPGFLTDLLLEPILLAEMSDRFNPVMERLAYLNEIYHRGSLNRNKRYNNVMDVLKALMEAYDEWLG
jgi:hypothetical protein